MSGIEIAGIALAVFPIVLDGILQNVEKFRHWRGFRVRLQGYASVIKAQRTYYLDTLEGLLTGIVESDEDMKHLTSEPDVFALEHPDYEQQLRERLDRTYETFLTTLGTMRDGLSAMCRKLGVSESGAVLWDEYSTIEKEMIRLKASFAKDGYKNLMTAVEKANKELRDITHQTIFLEPSRKVRRSRGQIMELKQIRRHAASLYQVLISGNAWKCQCRRHHMASLRLEQRPQIAQEKKTDPASTCKFRILMSSDGSRLTLQDVTHLHEIEVRPSLIKDPRPVPKPQSIMVKKRVNFAMTVPQDITRTTSAHESHDSSHTETAIVDICRTLWQTNIANAMIGFLIDETNRQHRHYLYRANTLPVIEPKSMTLSELLSIRHSNSPSGALLKRTRLDIAIVLASSVLQLDGTSWLGPGWTSRDIYFHMKSHDLNAHLSHPYLRWKSCVSDGDNDNLDRRSAEGARTTTSENLFALGLALIELCFGKPFSSLRKPEDEDLSEAKANANCAFRLLDFVYDEMDDAYGDVVRRCLKQPFDVRDLNLDIEEVQKKLYADIVAPLIENQKNLRGR